MSALTKYVPNKGLFIGGEMIMNNSDVTKWSQQFHSSPSVLGGLRLLSPDVIRGGNNIGHRPENMTYTTIGRPSLTGGNLIQREETWGTEQGTGNPIRMTDGRDGLTKDRIVHTYPPVITPYRPSNSTTISTPRISPYSPSPVTMYRDPYRLRGYLDLTYDELARDIERARFQRKLELLEKEYAEKKPTRRRRRRSRSTSKRKKRSTSKRRNRK